MTDRILDEVVHDLTPYGYEELDTSNMETYSTGVYELDHKKKYVDTRRVSSRGAYCVSNGEEIEVVYSHDIMADIILNNNTEESSRLTTEVNSRIKKDVIREISNYTSVYERRISLLKRKTITRAHKKIIRIIAENKVDMTIKKDAPIDMSIKEDEIKNFISLLK